VGLRRGIFRPSPAETLGTLYRGWSRDHLRLQHGVGHHAPNVHKTGAPLAKGVIPLSSKPGNGGQTQRGSQPNTGGHLSALMCYLIGAVSLAPTVGSRELVMLQTVDRALKLLTLFKEIDQEYRVGEIADTLGIDKSSASRLSATLAQRGFLERAPESEALRLGPELVRLGALAISSSHNLVELAKVTMERLAEETRETVNLARLDGGKAVNIAQIDGPHLVGVGDWIGWKTEPHATANGKVLLAFADGRSEDLPLTPPSKRSPNIRSPASAICAPSSSASDPRAGRPHWASWRRVSTASRYPSSTRQGAA
jgi:DNA-binding MarR family transcriptional regulator